MKKTFLVLTAALVAATFAQAAGVEQQPEKPRYVLTQQRIDSMVQQLQALTRDELQQSALKSKQDRSTKVAREMRTTMQTSRDSASNETTATSS